VTQTRRRALWALAVLAIGLGGAWILSLRPSRELSYQGKPIKRWLRNADLLSPYQEPTNEAAVAVRSMGAEVLPYLLREIQIIDSWAKSNLIVLSYKQSAVDLNWNADDDRRYDAAKGFSFLRERAHSAIPTLAKLVKDPQLGYAAVCALACLGTNGMLEVAGALAHTNRVVRLDAILNLEHLLDSQFRTNASPASLSRVQPQVRLAMTLLARAIRDVDPRNGKAAAKALGRVAPESDFAMPLLADTLRDKNISPKVRAGAAIGLGNMIAANLPMDPAQLMPVLTQPIDDPQEDIGVRHAALYAISRMAQTGFRPALDTLNRFTNDSEAILRDSAQELLTRIKQGTLAAKDE
jgi:hypothetical protein